MMNRLMTKTNVRAPVKLQSDKSSVRRFAQLAIEAGIVPEALRQRFNLSVIKLGENKPMVSKISSTGAASPYW